MYDPLVVDTFLASYQEIAPAARAAGQQAKSVIPTDQYEFSRAYDEGVSPNAPDSTSEGASLVVDATRAIASTDSVSAAIECAARYIRQLSPATICAFFGQTNGDVLRCIHAIGEGAERIEGMTIKKGERITGWVAANGTTVCNSDPTLDLGQTARLVTVPLKSTLSTPLVTGGVSIGVLTLYAPVHEAFTDAHKNDVEQVAVPLAEQLRQLAVSRRSSLVRFREPIGNQKSGEGSR